MSKYLKKFSDDILKIEKQLKKIKFINAVR